MRNVAAACAVLERMIILNIALADAFYDEKNSIEMLASIRFGWHLLPV